MSGQRQLRDDLPTTADTVYLRRLEARTMARSLSFLWVLPAVLLSAVVGYFLLLFSLFGVAALGGRLTWVSWALILGVPGALLTSICLVGFGTGRASAHWLAGLRVLRWVPAWAIGLMATLSAASAATALAAASLRLL